tara:strand:+ start:349 stop:1011 length:663 start_codon:yes stop_codon:yes gene_type:complete
MGERFIDAIGRAKSYVSKLAAQKNEYYENIDFSKVWQLDNTYIVSPVDSGIVIVDQMLAHQRILYENALNFLVNTIQGVPSSQTLLFPVELKLSSGEYSSLLDALPYLNKIGFNLIKKKSESIVLESIPSDMLWGNETEVISKILNSFMSFGKKELSKENAVALCFSMHACIKHGDSLNDNEMMEIINRLFGTEEPFVCPNGKPSIIQIPTYEIKSRFLK